MFYSVSVRLFLRQNFKKYKYYIEEIRIEGHTDPFWAGAETRQQEYLNNMELSQSRTRAVLVYAINMPALLLTMGKIDFLNCNEFKLIKKTYGNIR